jgi:hypothetical protein
MALPATATIMLTGMPVNMKQEPEEQRLSRNRSPSGIDELREKRQEEQSNLGIQGLGEYTLPVDPAEGEPWQHGVGERHDTLSQETNTEVHQVCCPKILDYSVGHGRVRDNRRESERGGDRVKEAARTQPQG